MPATPEGSTVAQVVHDYGDVCQIVTELLVEQRAPIAATDFQTLNLCLDDAGRVVGVEFCDASALLPSETLRPDTSTSAEGGITA